MPVTIERRGAVAVVQVESPPVNALSRAVREGLRDAAEQLDADPDIQAVVLVCAGRTFIAGADVAEFGKPPAPPHLPEVVARIERAAKPWTAAIHGTALGGGFEVALGCRFRVALASAKVGLPEVTLGIIPGAGGTVRVPRIAPLDDAVAMVTGGRPVTAARARDMGLIDRVVDDGLRDAAIAFAEETWRDPPPPVLDRAPPVPADDGYWARQEATVAKGARGQIAPLRALEAVRNAVTLDADAALTEERAIFLALRDGDQARALRHVFFAERAAAKVEEIAGVAPRAIGDTAVIGGGTMGAGIAVALLDAGLPVTLVERDEEALRRGLSTIEAALAAAAKRGRITQQAAVDRLAALRATTDYADLSRVDLVIEAVFEDLDVKRAVFRQLDAACRPGAVLATNTSYLDPNEIAAATNRPGDVIGLHFFSPANVMKLLEIVRMEATAPDVLATGFALAKRLGKVAVLAGVCDGFIGNRILKTYRAQAERLLLAGASPRDVDGAMRAFGLPMGPFEAQDLGGLDIALFQRKAARARGAEVFAPIADRLCALERFGQKTGGGWYDYAPGDRTPVPSPTVDRIIAEEAEKAGTVRREFGTEEMQRRILFPMIDEGARIVEEGIARRPLDVDLVEIHGYGFPRWRGGLLHHADTIGLAEIVAALTDLARDGGAPAPSGLLSRMAAEARRLDDLNA